MTGISGHDKPESPVTIRRNDRSRSTGIPNRDLGHLVLGDQVGVEQAIKAVQRAHRLADLGLHRIKDVVEHRVLDVLGDGGVLLQRELAPLGGQLRIGRVGGDLEG